MWIKILEWLKDFINKFLNKKIETAKEVEKLDERLEDKVEEIQKQYNEETEKINNMDDDGSNGADFWMQHKTIGESDNKD